MNGDPVSFQQWNNNPSGSNNYQIQLKIIYIFKQFLGLCKDFCSPDECHNSCTSTNQWQDNANLSIFPHFNPSQMKSQSCVLMLIHNLGQPLWASINCDRLLLGDVLCLIEHKKSVEISVETRNTSRRNMCSPFHILRNKTCYWFTWFEKNSTIKHLYEGRILKGEMYGINKWQYLFDAIAAKFPPIISDSLTYSVTYDKYFNKYKYSYKTGPLKGIHVKSLKMTSILESDILFQCGDGVYISYSFVCDGVPDCLNTSLDEANCGCKMNVLKNNTENKYKWLEQEQSSRRLFSYSTQINNCKIVDLRLSFTKPNHLEDSNSFVSSTFICNNGLKIDQCLVNDLVADCGPEGEDEPHLKLILIGKMIFNCKQPDQIPCSEGHSNCFSISKICTFELNDYGRILPCRTGGHLHNCKAFECNMMFKCPSFYCIPWPYVCDGKWDCPNGIDEGFSQKCGSVNRCMSLYKCRNYQICVHLGSLCDSHDNCPLGDDELYCSIYRKKCPSICDCLLYAIRCYNTSLTKLHMTFQIPYYIVHFEMCFIETFVTNFVNVKILNIVNCGYKKICKIAKNLQSAIKLNFGFNLISKLGHYCFEKIIFLKSIMLNNNLLVHIYRNTFKELTELIYLNLDKNLILTLHEQFITGCKLILSIKGNALSLVRKNNFMHLQIKAIFPSNFLLCCFTPPSVLCNAGRLWFISCSSLLNGKLVYCIAILMAASILFTNIISCGLQLWSYFKRKKLANRNSFNINIAAVNLSDIICGVYLFLFLINNSSYNDYFIFREDKWRSSLACFSLFALSIIFNTLSPLLHLVISISRLIIATNPFCRKIKNSKLVFKCNFLLFAAITVIVVFITVVIKHKEKELPFKLCSPFADPSKSVMSVKILSISLIIFQLTIFFIIIYCYVHLSVSLKEVTRATENK